MVVTVGEAVRLECVHKSDSCLAHGCMAWRQVSASDDKMQSTGYCGMAGCPLSVEMGYVLEVMPRAMREAMRPSGGLSGGGDAA